MGIDGSGIDGFIIEGEKLVAYSYGFGAYGETLVSVVSEFNRDIIYQMELLAESMPIPGVLKVKKLSFMALVYYMPIVVRNCFVARDIDAVVTIGLCNSGRDCP